LSTAKRVKEELEKASVDEIKEAEPKKPVSKRVVKKELPLNTLVKIKNGYSGTLVIGLPKSGYDVILNNFGDEDAIELGELRQIRNSHPDFFEKNWILLDDHDVIEFLNVQKFYKNTLNPDEFEELFEKEPDEVTSTLLTMSDGQKTAFARRARQKIEDGTLDSRNTIKAIEKTLGYSLTEE
jgi:hypothetical protein